MDNVPRRVWKHPHSSDVGCFEWCWMLSSAGRSSLEILSSCKELLRFSPTEFCSFLLKLVLAGFLKSSWFLGFLPFFVSLSLVFSVSSSLGPSISRSLQLCLLGFFFLCPFVSVTCHCGRSRLFLHSSISPPSLCPACHCIYRPSTNPVGQNRLDGMA